MNERADLSPAFGPMLCGLLSLALLPAPFGRAATAPELVPATEPPRVFGGGSRTVPVRWRNGGDQPTSVALSMRIYQASSATAAPLTKTPWKELNLLPGQTVLESVTLDFPAVNAETEFLVQWLQNNSNVLGVTQVLAYPTNLVRELGVLAGAQPLGLYDPQNQLKPLLRMVNVEYIDLEQQGLEDFVGKLLVVGPFASREQVSGWLSERLWSQARRGAAAVWILPPPQSGEPIKPSFYTVLEGKGAIVVVQAAMIGDLEQNPQAQLNLVEFCRLAVKPQPLHLPSFAAQP